MTLTACDEFYGIHNHFKDQTRILRNKTVVSSVQVDRKFKDRFVPSPSVYSQLPYSRGGGGAQYVFDERMSKWATQLTSIHVFSAFIILTL